MVLYRWGTAVSKVSYIWYLAIDIETCKLLFRLFPLHPFILNYGINEINYNHNILWDVITHPCPDLNGDRTKLMRNISHSLCMQLHNHVLNWIPVSSISVRYVWDVSNTLQWRHNERNGVSDHQPHDCLPNRLFTHRSIKTSKLRITGLSAGNSPVTKSQ